MGATDVAVEARHPHQHEARERIGAVVPTSGYDVVIETGGSETLCTAPSSLRGQAARSYISACTAPGTVWPMDAAFSKEVAVRPSLGYCSHYRRRDFAAAADLLAARRSSPAP